MRSFQFYVLLFSALIVSALMVKQIFLSRAIYTEQHLLVDNEEIASTGEAYQSTWKQLAVHIYQESRQDPALAAILTKEKVAISTTPPPLPGTSTNAPSSKIPGPSTTIPPH